MRRKSNKAFTLAEILIAITISTVVLLGAYASFKLFKQSGVRTTREIKALQEVRSALDVIKHDILAAKRIYNNDTPVSTTPGLPPDQTTSTNLILELPSIDSSGEIINVSNEYYTDYCQIYVNSDKQLIRKIHQSDQASSARTIGEFVLAENILAISFSNGTEDIGSLTYQQLDALNYLKVSVYTTIEQQDGSTEQKSLSMNVVMRNYYNT